MLSEHQQTPMAFANRKKIRKLKFGLEEVPPAGRKKVISYNNSMHAFGNNNTQPYELKKSGLVFAVLK